MSRIVIASASAAGRERLSGLLAASGYTVFRMCGSGGELRRALNACEDGVALLLGVLPDCLPDELADDFGASFHILLVARTDALSACESSRIFKLIYPCTGSTILGAVEMLSQLHAMGLPKRTEEEQALVGRAKALLMRRQGLTEAQAHRYMQQYAMRHNMKMKDYAIELLQGGSDHA